MIGAIGALFGGVRRFSGKDARMRARIEHDLKLRDSLKEGSSGRIALDRHIDHLVRNLVTLERDQDNRRTDPYGLIWLVIFIGLAVGAGVTAWRTRYDWWVDLMLWLSTALLVLLTMVGATVTFRQPPKSDEPT